MSRTEQLEGLRGLLCASTKPRGGQLRAPPPAPRWCEPARAAAVAWCCGAPPPSGRLARGAARRGAGTAAGQLRRGSALMPWNKCSAGMAAPLAPAPAAASDEGAPLPLDPGSGSSGTVPVEAQASYPIASGSCDPVAGGSDPIPEPEEDLTADLAELRQFLNIYGRWGATTAVRSLAQQRAMAQVLTGAASGASTAAAQAGTLGECR